MSEHVFKQFTPEINREDLAILNQLQDTIAGIMLYREGQMVSSAETCDENFAALGFSSAENATRQGKSQLNHVILALMAGALQTPAKNAQAVEKIMNDETVPLTIQQIIVNATSERDNKRSLHGGLDGEVVDTELSGAGKLVAEAQELPAGSTEKLMLLAFAAGVSAAARFTEVARSSEYSTSYTSRNIALLEDYMKKITDDVEAQLPPIAPDEALIARINSRLG